MFEKQFGEELEETLETKQLRALLLMYCSLSVVFLCLSYANTEMVRRSTLILEIFVGLSINVVFVLSLF